MYIYNKLLIVEHDLIYAISNNTLLCNIIYDQSKIFVNVNKKLYNIIYKVIVRIAHIHTKYKRKENKITEQPKYTDEELIKLFDEQPKRKNIRRIIY
jgi:hypothetical protein